MAHCRFMGVNEKTFAFSIDLQGMGHPYSMLRVLMQDSRITLGVGLSWRYHVMVETSFVHPSFNI